MQTLNTEQTTQSATQAFTQAFGPVPGSAHTAGSLSELAFITAGPAAVGFVEWIITQARQDRIDHILFLGQSGYILHDLMQSRRAASTEEPFASSHHLPASQALFILTCMDPTHILGNDTSRFFNRLSDFIGQSQDLCLPELLARSGVPVPSAGVLANLGLDTQQSIAQLDLKKLTDFLFAWRPEIAKICQNNRRGLYRYMVENGLADGARIALVNLDWQGATQELFARALGEFMPLNITGYSFALSETKQTRERQKSLHIKSFLQTSTLGAGMVEALAANHVLTEFLFSAPQAPVIGFSPRNHDYTVDEGRLDTRHFFTQAAEVQTGIRQFACHMAQAENRPGYGLPAPIMAGPLLNFIVHDHWARHPQLQAVQNFDPWINSARHSKRLTDYAVKPHNG